MATPRMFWERVRAQAEALPIWRGGWTNDWNFGCLSAAHAARSRLARADAACALASVMAGGPAPEGPLNTRWAGRAFRLHRDEALMRTCAPQANRTGLGHTA